MEENPEDAGADASLGGVAALIDDAGVEANADADADAGAGGMGAGEGGAASGGGGGGGGGGAPQPPPAFAPSSAADLAELTKILCAKGMGANLALYSMLSQAGLSGNAYDKLVKWLLDEGNFATLSDAVKLNCIRRYFQRRLGPLSSFGRLRAFVGVGNARADASCAQRRH